MRQQQQRNTSREPQSDMPQLPPREQQCDQQRDGPQRELPLREQQRRDEPTIWQRDQGPEYWQQQWSPQQWMLQYHDTSNNFQVQLDVSLHWKMV